MKKLAVALTLAVAFLSAQATSLLVATQAQALMISTTTSPYKPAKTPTEPDWRKRYFTDEPEALDEVEEDIEEEECQNLQDNYDAVQSTIDDFGTTPALEQQKEWLCGSMSFHGCAMPEGCQGIN